MKSRQRAETFGKPQILDPSVDIDKMIKPPALALNLELEGNKVGLPGQEAPFALEGKQARSSNIQFQPAQENDQSSRLTEEVNESFEGIEEVKEIEEEVASGKQSSYSYTRQDA